MQDRGPSQSGGSGILSPDVVRMPVSDVLTSGDPRLLSLAVGVVIVTALYVAREILIPIALAILLSFVLAPLVRLLRRARLGRVPAVVVAVVLALGAILSLGGLIGTQVSQVVVEIPRYTVTIESKIAGVRSLLVGQFSESFGLLGKRIQQASSEPQPAASNSARTAAPGPVEQKPVPVEMHQPTATSFEITERILLPFVAPLATAGIVFIVAIFILLQQTDLRDRFIRLFGLQDQHRTTTALGDAGTRLSHYLLALLGLNVAFGMIIGLGLLIIGVPNPLLWATLAGLSRFVPYIGSLVAGLLPTAFAAAIDPGWGLAFWTAGLFFVTETAMGQVIDPLAFGRSTGLSPVSVVVAAIFWSWLWGPIGLILSMPLTLCLVVLGRHVPRLQFLEVLMGDRPALTPVEGFYQRILANDLDETLNYVEALLQDRSLEACYDDVLINSLRLAAHDAERGVLTPAQLARIRRTMAHLLDELATSSPPAVAMAVLMVDGKPDAAPGMPMTADAAIPATDQPDSPPAGTILCISGRGVLDEPVTVMLVQLLGGQHVKAAGATSEAASREEIASLDVGGIAMVCITCLELSGSPSHLRYLIRRIRGRMPDVPILVGLWPEDDSVALRDERIRSAIGADYYTTSLHEAVTTCLSIRGANGESAVPEKGSSMPVRQEPGH